MNMKKWTVDRATKWTVDRATWVHQNGFIWSIFWGDSERGRFKNRIEAQEYCDEKNKKSAQLMPNDSTIQEQSK